MDIIHKPLSTGGRLTADSSGIRCFFPERRLALSTSLFNGGYRLVEGIFNHHLSFYVDTEQELPGGSLNAYMEQVARQYQLVPALTTGLITAAKMSSMAHGALSYKDLTVEAITTAGTSHNAVRAGEPACYYEENGQYHPIAGTINIMVIVNAAIPEGSLAKAIITVTEAKTAALTELGVPSCYTAQTATGTGTDGVIIVASPDADLRCADTGTHSKLGELLARVVGETVKKSLTLAGDV